MNHQANKYMWSLISQLATATGKDEIEVYKAMLKLNKNYMWVLVETDKANDFIVDWTAHGSGWMAERVKDKENGTAIKVYKGVSMYTTEEQTALIRTVQEECKKVGIETMTDRELAVLQEGTHND